MSADLARSVALKHCLLEHLCSACEGQRWFIRSNAEAPSGAERVDPCDVCRGTGRIWRLPLVAEPAWSDEDLVSGAFPGFAPQKAR